MGGVQIASTPIFPLPWVSLNVFIQHMVNTWRCTYAPNSHPLPMAAKPGWEFGLKLKVLVCTPPPSNQSQLQLQLVHTASKLGQVSPQQQLFPMKSSATPHPLHSMTSTDQPERPLDRAGEGGASTAEECLGVSTRPPVRDGSGAALYP